MAKYKLKEGVELRPYGANSLITNDNLTDSIAEHLLSTNKADTKDFEINETVLEIIIEEDPEIKEEVKTEELKNINKNNKKK